MALSEVKVVGCILPLTKLEVLMNMVQRPETRSNIFIERGKVTVFEKAQRLGQINSIGELVLHGYGYYKVEKQP
tara:strand:+ start:1138 stop:1359 length:222 start_codon:yes stop_codon:yes gene_type:complete